MEIVVISNDSSLDAGETAVMACVGFDGPGVEINWSFNGALVANTSLVTIMEEDIVDGGRSFIVSFLQICSLSASDAGGYTCIASSGQAAANATTQLYIQG